MFPWLTEEMARYVLIFFVMGATKIAAGLLGLSTEHWLRGNAGSFSHAPVTYHQEPREAPVDISPERSRRDFETTLLFGVAQLIMGVSSGMVVPYLIPWVNAAFNPEPFVLGTLPSVANITLATGTLVVGLTSERTGKLRLIFLLYLATPFLTIGLVYAPLFLVMSVFYVARMSVANMVRPATTSLFMEEIGRPHRARAWAVTRVMWTFSRQTGTLLTSLLLSQGGQWGIVEFGVLFFPLAMMLYPVSVLPMWIAVRRNKDLVHGEYPH